MGRKPYYLGMGVAALCVLLSARGRDDLARKGLPALAVIFLAGAGIAAYHAGVEWKFWPGPPECTGGTSAPLSHADFLSRLKLVKPIRCDEPALLYLGLQPRGVERAALLRPCRGLQPGGFGASAGEARADLNGRDAPECLSPAPPDLTLKGDERNVSRRHEKGSVHDPFTACRQAGP